VDLDAVYRRSPYPARVAMASARGLVLRRRRYGRDLEERVAAALDRETWSADRWRTWQGERLDAVLRIARDQVPAYGSVPPRPRPGGVAADVDALGSWPLLDKARLRADPQSFVRRDAPPRLVTEHTSGTTGTPLHLVISRDDYREWYALAEARWRRWYGVGPKDRWAIIGGQPVAPAAATRPPYWVWNAAMRQLYLSGYHVADHTAADYVAAIDRHQVRYLLGYPSTIHALAVSCRRLGLRPRPLAVVVGNAEPVLEHQRAVISEVFGCPVRESYGMAEYVAAASECEEGRLHLWPEVGHLEVLDPEVDRAVAPGQVGRFACTGLLNRTMVLVRYLVGDAGRVAADDGCGCGRHLPVLDAVEGRWDDLVRTRDGRVIGRLDPVFKGDLPIRGAQIVQHDLDRFQVLVVPDEGFDDAAVASITTRLRERVGPVDVEVAEVPALPLGPNGKFKAVVSHVTEAP
jgi:phenylacetate-CoA ligase